MRRRVDFRPWRHILRLGDRGPRVMELQKALVRLGFYPAVPDGVYGYLTQDAVERLQKEFGLTVDGIVGPMVERLLAKPGPRKLRLHLQDTSLARSHSVATLLIGYVYSEEHIMIDQFSRTGRELSALAFDWWDLAAPTDEVREPSEKLQLLAAATRARYLPVITNNASGGDHLLGTRSLANRELIRWLRERMRRVLSRTDVMGIMLRLGEIPAAVGPEVRRFLRDTAQLTREREKFLLVCVHDWKRIQPTLWGIPWPLVTDYVDYVVLEPGVSNESASLLPMGELNRLLPRWLKKVPPWQLVVSLPVGGVIPGRGRLTYNEVRTIAYRKKAMIQWDQESLSPMYKYQEPGGDGSLQEVLVWYENGESLARKIAAAKGLKIAGLMIVPLGYEDSRTWEVIKLHCVVGHV